MNVKDGNKGIISRIIPDNELPVSEYGEVPDIVLNPLGVCGRQNIAQLYEHELNFIANEIIRKHKNKPKTAKKNVNHIVYEELWDDIIQFLSIVNIVQAEFLVETLETYEDIVEFCDEVLENGLFIHQPPFFDNITPNALSEAYETFGIQKTKFEGIFDKLIFGDLYFIQLKHEAASKFSARSAGQVNLLNIPFKSNDQFKKNTALHNNSPLRLGEQELMNLMLLGNDTDSAKNIIQFLRNYSSSNVDRKHLITTLLKTNAKDIGNVGVIDGNATNAAQVIRSFFNGIGIVITNNEADQIAELIEVEEE